MLKGRKRPEEDEQRSPLFVPVPLLWSLDGVCYMTTQLKFAVELTNIKVQRKILVRFPHCTPKIRVPDKRNDNVAHSAGRESCEF